MGVELDKENDYYMRPASPANTHDPYADDDGYSDPYDTYHPEIRRIAPPPPPEFVAREERERSRYADSPPPRTRRIAPPRSPSPRGDVPHPPVPPGPGVQRGGHGRFRGGEDWADPWMRGGPEKQKMGRGDRSGGRRRSYSSGSSRTSSGSSRSRSPRRRRRYSSSYSSRSSSRSRSRSSTPAGIPRRHDAGAGGSKPVKREPTDRSRNTAPLQKRLAGVTQGREKKQRRSRGDDSSDDERSRNKSGHKGEKSKDLDKKPREPFKMNIPKNQIKLSLKGSGSSKPSSSTNNEVFEKPGAEEPSKKSLKRKSDDGSDVSRQQQKLASKKSKMAKLAAAAAGLEAEGGGSEDTKNRREELLKQLRAVEEAIHRKRSKLDK